MKNILLLFLTIISLTSFGQSEGIIKYEETRKLNFKVPAQFADMIPKSVENEMLLIFNAKESIYKLAPLDETALNPQANRFEQMQMRFKRRRANNITYRNMEENVNIDKQSFMGRDFLIDGSKEEIKWKMRGDQKKIAGYICMKATYMKNDTIPMTAWWTPQIPVANGPGNNGQLPGLVLALDENNGDVVIVAKEIDLRPLTPEEEIARPEKGKSMTREDYNAMMKEKMEEMKEMGGGNGFRMRRN